MYAQEVCHKIIVVNKSKRTLNAWCSASTYVVSAIGEAEAGESHEPRSSKINMHNK
jgi:hypothetical protein